MFLKNIFLLFISISISFSAYSQKEKCFADVLLQNKLEEDPSLSQKLEIQERQTQAFIKNYPSQLVTREVMTIPVVVHVVWEKIEQNISDEQIRSQIEVLNKDFRNNNSLSVAIPSEFNNLIADMEIEFCLASRDPDGKATNGITRTQTSFEFIVDEYASNNRRRIKHEFLGGHSAWDTKKYLNIWVGKYTPGTLGEGCFPGICSDAEDGIIVDPFVFGTKGTAANNTPNNMGRTTTHEVGHYFDLRHLWGSKLGDCDSDDMVADTPAQFFPTDGCPNHPKTTCSSNDLFMNYMDYTDDACMGMFSKGQKLRILATLNGARSGLLNSDGCETVSASYHPSLIGKLKLYPNPTKDFLTLDFAFDVKEELTIRLINLVGKVVYQTISSPKAILQINGTDFPLGIYFVRIESGGASVSRRVVIF